MSLHIRGGGQGKREGEKRGREGREEGEGGGRRGGGRREKRGREEGEEGAGGGRGEEKREGGERGKFCAREARAAPEGRGEVRGGKGGEAYPLSTPSYKVEVYANIFWYEFLIPLSLRVRVRLIPNVTCNHISVIKMTAHRCAGGLKKMDQRWAPNAIDFS